MENRKRQDSATVQISASPERVYALVADITRMGEWSPECRHCEWIGGATGAEVGARFKARNKAQKGPGWSNKPEVIVADPGREFSFSRSGFGIGEVIWRYRIEPREGGTVLTESYEVVQPAAKPVLWLTAKMTGIVDRVTDLQNNMQTTLQRVKSAAESVTRAPADQSLNI